MDFLMQFNTAYYDKQTQGLVLSRRTIAHRYLRRQLVVDLLSSVPICTLLLLADKHTRDSIWWCLLFDVTVRSQRLLYLVRKARTIARTVRESPKRRVFEWLLYSRYSHLLRIASIILFIVLIAHYLACGWRFLFISAPMRGSPLEEYVACFYDVLQLLQGQGVPTATVAQNIYATVAIFMGSLVLAVVFGNVAILVSNFNANATSYQRKMDSVFAIMSKLQLPAPLRERIHQYYEHLWREYESLDGEIVAFSKGLSHTLELEVVLFKYMDLIMHVPFWRDGSPDFQKQLMLSLHVRVYLPDDLLIRRGEVGDEFFMINRGICELALGPDSFECTTPPLATFKDSAAWEQSNYIRVKSNGRMVNGEEHTSTYIHSLQRGQTFGELALLSNYERTANVRAIPHDEMCVLLREDFQRILLKHGKDREHILVGILSQTMERNAAAMMRCPLRAIVVSVFGEDNGSEVISPADAALLVTRAVDRPLDDEYVPFGVGSSLRKQLTDLRGKQRPETTPIPAAIQSIPSTETNKDLVHIRHESVSTLYRHVGHLQSIQTDAMTLLAELVDEVRSLRLSTQEILTTMETCETQFAQLRCVLSDHSGLLSYRSPRTLSRVKG